MIQNIKELSRTSTYEGHFEGKKVEWEQSQDYSNRQPSYELLTVDGETTIPSELEEKILEAIEKSDFSDAELL